MNDESESVNEVSKTSSVNGASTADQAGKNRHLEYLEAVPEENNMTSTFHIPESNASDIAPSESSSHYHRKGTKFL